MDDVYNSNDIVHMLSPLQLPGSKPVHGEVNDIVHIVYIVSSFLLPGAKPVHCEVLTAIHRLSEANHKISRSVAAIQTWLQVSDFASVKREMPNLLKVLSTEVPAAMNILSGIKNTAADLWRENNDLWRENNELKKSKKDFNDDF